MIQKILAYWKNRRKKVLALMSFDGIGDYLFIRLFFPYIQACEKYKNYRFILIGRNNFGPFAQQYDTYFFEDIMWITNPQDPKELRAFLKKIRRYSIAELVCPTGGTDYLFAAPLLKRIRARKKIVATAFDPQHTREPYEQLADQVIKPSNTNPFEFYRVKSFFEHLLGQSIPLEEPRIKLALPPPCIPLKTPYAVLVPFTSTASKDWDMERYVLLVRHLVAKYNLQHVVILGTDTQKINELVSKINSPRVLAPHTQDISQALSLLPRARFIVSTDTSFLHYGAQMGIKTIYLAGSFSYSIFHPYPSQFTHVCGIYPPQFLTDKQQGHIAFDTLIAPYSVKAISTEYAIGQIDQFLCKNK